MIKRYEPADSDELVAIWQAASRLAHPFLSEEFLAQEALNLRDIYLPNAETHVSMHEGRVAGFIAFLGNEIGGLFLDPALHGRGIGLAMLNHGRALKGELEAEVFTKNAIGRRFYDRAGFQELSRYLHEDTMQEVIRMKLAKTS